MTVIGSVEFEASLSLDKFNQQLDSLITKNKTLITPINAVLNFDQKNQIRKITTKIPILKIKVDSRELTRLGQSFKLEQKHHRETQQYFNKNKLIVKVDNREIDTSIQKVKELKNEIASLTQAKNTNNSKRTGKTPDSNSSVTVSGRPPTPPNDGSGGAAVSPGSQAKNNIKSLSVDSSKDFIEQSQRNLKESVSESKRASDQISKTIEETSKKGVLSKLTDGLILGVGQNLSKQFSTGFLKNFQKTTGIKSGEVGKAIGGFTGSVGKNAVESARKIGGNFLEEVGINNLETQVRDIFSDAIVDALDESVTLTDLFTNLSKNLAKAIGSQEVQGAVENLTSKVSDINTYTRSVGVSAPKSGSILQSPVLQQIGKKIAPQLEKTILKSRQENLSRRAVPLVLERVDQIINESKSEPLTEDAIAKGIKQAERLKGKMVQGVDASKLAMGKLVNVDAPAAIREETKELIITIGGYAGDAKSASGMRIAGELVYEFNKMGRKDVAAIGLANPDTNLKPASMKEAATKMQALLSSVVKPNIRGYSKDAVELAAQSISALLSSPDLKVKLVGESGGGFAVEEAIAILNQMGFGDRVEGAGFGTPNLIGGINPPNYKKYIGKDPAETLGYETHQVYAPAGFADVTPPEQNLTGLTGHPYEHYAPRDEFQEFAFSKPKSGKDSLKATKLDKEQGKQIQDEIKKIKKILTDVGQLPGGSSQEIKAYLSQISKSLAGINISGEVFGSDESSSLKQDIENITKTIESEIENIDVIAQYKTALEQGEKILQQIASSDNEADSQKLLNLLKKDSAKIQNALLKITQSADSNLAKSLAVYFRNFQSKLNTWSKSGKNEMQLDVMSDVAEQKLKELINDFDKDTAIAYSKAIEEIIANFDMGSAKNPDFATEKLEKLSAIYEELNKLTGETVEEITQSVEPQVQLPEPIKVPTPKVSEIQKTDTPPVLTSEEIDSIAADLKAYFKSETLKEALKATGQQPTGKNASQYAKQLAESLGVDALSKTYQTKGREGLTQKGKTKEESLTKERLLEQKGYQIIKALYAQLKQQLQQKEQDLKVLAKTLNQPGEKRLEKDLKAASNKALEASEAVKQTVAEIEAIKAQYNIPQSVGRNISGMVDALQSYSVRAKNVAEEINQGEIALERIALPELKLSDYEKQLEPVEIPKQLKNAAESQQQMFGLGALGLGATFFGGQGAANAATGVAGAVGGTAIAPIAVPIALTIAGGAGAIAISKAVRPFLEKHARPLADVLYLNVGDAIKGLGGSLKKQLDGAFGKVKNIFPNGSKGNNFSSVAKNINEYQESFGDFIEELESNQSEQVESVVNEGQSTFEKAFQQFNESIPDPIKPIIASFKNLGKVILGVGIFGFFQNQLQNISSQTFEVTKRFITLENTVNFLSGGAKKGAEQMAFLRAEVYRTSSVIEPAIKAYKDLAASTRNTPLEGRVTNNLTSAILQAGTVFGMTGEQVEGSILAISQIAGKGTVSMEELRGQLAERIPGAFQIAARSMNVTEQELFKLISTGQLAASDFLPKFASQLSLETAGGVTGASKTAQSALNRLNNAILEIQVEAGKQLQGGLVIGLDTISSVLQFASKHAKLFTNVLIVAAGAALVYTAPAVIALAKSLMAIPLASFAATTAVSGLKVAIMSLIVPAVAGFAAKVAIVWVVIEAIKVLANVWDAFAGKTTSQTWSEALSTNLKKSKQDVEDLRKEIDKTNKLNTPSTPDKPPETEYSINKESLKGRLEEKGIVGRMRYALSPWEYMPDMFSTGGALKQTIKDQRDFEDLKQSRKSGSIKELENWIVPAMTQENIDKIKEYNKQIESLRQKSTLIKDPIQQTRIKEQIEQIRKYRDVAGTPLEHGLKYAMVEIENRKKQINETNDSKLKKQYQDDIEFFEEYVGKLKEIERQTGAQTTLTELIQVLSRLRVEMETFNRVAQELADKNLRKIAESELKDLGSNVFASAEAGLKRAENSLTLAQEKVKGSKTTIKGLQALLQDPLMTQYNDFYKDKSLEQLRVDLEGVDEADGQRRKALEAMILLREQESGMIALQREEAESVLALEKERSQVLLSRFDFQKAEDQNKVQVGEAKSLTRITRSRLGGQFNQSEMDEARAKVSLNSSQQNQKLSQDQLATLQGYYNQGKISAEEFATRRRELELQVAQTVQQVADNELQLRQATQTKILEQIDRRIAIANAKQQQTENASTQAIRQQQLDRVINEQQAEVRIAQVRKTSLAQNLQAVQTQLEEVRSAYAKKQIEESEFRQRERDLMTQSSDLSRQLVEQELQIRQSLQNEILTQIERRLANANALQQQGENASTQAIRQQQLARIITEQQAESQIAQIRKKSLTQNLEAVKKQLEEIRAAHKKGQIEEIEFNQRQRDLATQLSDLNKQLVEQDLQIQQQKQQTILDLLERQNQRLDHQLKIQEAIAQLNQKSGQIRRETIGTQQELSLLSNPRQREALKLQLTRQTEDETLVIQQQTSTRYTAELQRRLSELRKHYEDGNLSQREYEDRSRQIEQELTTAKVQLKDYELQNAQRINQRLIEDRERMNRQMVEDLDRAIKKQDSLLQLSAIQNEQRIRQRQLSQANSIGNGRAEQQAAIALTRFQEEQLKKQLKATIEQIQEVAKLREENALTQWEAEDRTSDLTIKSEQLKLDLINKQIEKTRQLKDLRIQALDDELARIDSLFGRQQMGLTYEIEQRKLITDELDREKSLLESQSRLQQALIRGEEQRAQATLDRSRNAEDLMGRLPELQKRLSEGGLDYQQQRGTQYLRELIQQFSGAQTGNAMLPESQLQQLRTNQYNESANAEQRLLEMKTRHLEQQQRIQLAQTELQQRMNRLTAENNIMEANISVNKARQAELQAKIALDKARVNGDPREIQNAQLSYDLARQSTLLSQQQFDNAVQRLSLTDQLSGLDQQSTLAEQGNERFALGESNRKALQDLALRGGELASQGSISLDSMLRIDPTSIQYGLEPIAPAIDNLSTQLNSKFDQMLTELKELNNKPTSASVESLTIVSSDPTGDSRQVLDDMVRARNMYER